MPTITAFKSSPDDGQGHARDMRVRWAFEEVGQSYDVVLRSFKTLKQPKHLAPIPSAPFQHMKKALSRYSSRAQSFSILQSAIMTFCPSILNPEPAR
jgi:hypothetical protein